MEDWCFPGCVPRTVLPAAGPTTGKLLFLSGLDLADEAETMALNLLVEWIDGMVGDSAIQKEEASIVRVIIAGD